MINNILNINLLKSNTIAGIDLNILNEDDYIIHYLELKKEKRLIKINKKVENINDFNNVVEINNNKVPVILNLSGKGIVHKKIINENNNDQEILQKIFPNANINDFYIQKHSLDNINICISLIRKKTLNKIIDLFKQEKIFVLNFFLGPLSLNHLIPLIEDKKEKIILPDTVLETNGNNITDFKFLEEPEKNNKNYLIGSDHVNNKYLKAFASAFSYFQEDKTSLINLSYLEKENEEFKYKQIFNKVGWGILICMLLLLLINYLLFSHYNQKQKELTNELSKKQNIISNLDLLKSELKRKKQFIEERNLLGHTRLSFYTDRLAKTLPDNIILEKLEINPLTGKIKRNEDISFINNTIIITGTTNNSTILNTWIEELKKIKWIEKIDIINYKQETLYTSGDFIIEILINYI